MNSLKSFIFSIFNWFYPFVAFALTNCVLDCLPSYYTGYKNALGAILLSILLIIPYIVFRLCKYVGVKTYKKYFIFENLWLIFFTLFRLISSSFEYITTVWGIAFIGISIVDKIIEIETE